MLVKQALITQAYRYALDPTPAQERAFTSHVGGARFAYNWGLATYAAALDAREAEKAAGEKPTTRLPGHFELCRLWTAHKDTTEWVDRDTGETTTGIPWVSRNFSGTYQAALRDVHGAWRKFWDSRNGSRAGRKMGRPRFKSKHRSRPAFQVHGSGLQVADSHHVKLPTIGTVKTFESTRKLLRLLQTGQKTCPDCSGQGHIRRGPKTSRSQRRLFHGRPAWMSDRFKTCQSCKGNGKLDPTPDARLQACPTCKATGQVPGKDAPKNCPDCKGHTQVPTARIVRGTISQHSDGRWYLALTVQRIRQVRTSPSRAQRNGGTIGIDLGVRSLVVTSDGQTVDHPKHLTKSLGKLAAAQKVASRREKGSARREKANRKVARLHARVGHLRSDATQKLTSHLIHHHQRIGVEGWDVQQTAQHGSKDVPKKVRAKRNLALADANLGQIRWQLQSKAVWYGTHVVVSGKHTATGRTCSVCSQERANPVPPHHEEFQCPECGWVGDRRVNTARVLAQLAQQQQNDASSAGESLNARGADVSPARPRPGGQLAVKREARSRSEGRGDPGSPGP